MKYLLIILITLCVWPIHTGISLPKAPVLEYNEQFDKLMLEIDQKVELLKQQQDSLLKL